jgi:polyisoprenoid-binding protein YceI
LKVRTVGIVRNNLVLSAAAIIIATLLSVGAAHHPPQTASAPAVANEIVLNIDPAQSTVQYEVSSTVHTVHGTFAVKRGSLRVELGTGKAAGEIVVDATSGQSGNNSRDKKMNKEVLETARFTDIVFRPDHVEGAVQPQGSSTAQLHGTLVLHGGEHEITVPVQAALNSGQWKGTSHFTVPYVAWGLKNPSNFLLKVEHAVNIEVDMAGTVQSQVAESK